MRSPYHRYFPPLLGALFILAAIAKLLHPGLATMALESLDLPTSWAQAIVACVTGLELYLGAILIFRLELKWALVFSTLVMSAFTVYLFYLSTLAHPPSCGCLGLTGIFQNSRHEALLGLARNCAILWLIKWAYDRHFPKVVSPGEAQVAATAAQNQGMQP
jgi:hypothetical protein